jgi:hypothetical protein
MSSDDEFEDVAAAAVAFTVQGCAVRRDLRGPAGAGARIRDFDIRVDGRPDEPLEVTQFVDRPALETLQRALKPSPPASSLSRVWLVDVHREDQPETADYRQLREALEPLLAELEKRGVTKFTNAFFYWPPEHAEPLQALVQLGVRVASSEPSQSGQGQINFERITTLRVVPGLVTAAVEAEANKPDNIEKLAEPADAEDRHLCVVVPVTAPQASFTLLNVVLGDAPRELLGDVPSLPPPITKAWVLPGFGSPVPSIYVTNPDGWARVDLPPEVGENPQRWICSHES